MGRLFKERGCLNLTQEARIHSDDMPSIRQLFLPHISPRSLINFGTAWLKTDHQSECASMPGACKPV
eukprot:332986-Pelagomonas_calceolata.AAC.3